MTTSTPEVQVVTTSTDDQLLRKTYVNIFHELQFRASKNALMNYYQAEELDDRDTVMKALSGTLLAASSAGILAGIYREGKILASRFGLAGFAGLPISFAMQLFINCSSEFLPSHQERAKKHTQAAAAWNSISDRARVARLRLLQDRNFTQDKYVVTHEQLLQDKEKVQRSVVLPRDIHRKFNTDAENVFAAIKRRKETFKQFKNYHLDEDQAEAADNEKDAYYM